MRLHLLTLTDSKHQIIKYIVINLINYLKIQLIFNNKFHKFNKSFKDSSKQRLNKSINNHFLTKYKVYLNLIALVQITDVIIEDINVF